MNEILDDEIIGKKYSPENVRFASFWTRVAASILDSFVLMPILFLGVYNMMTWKSLPLYFVLQLAALIYKPWMEAEYGATIGKMATKIKVVTIDYQDINLQQSLNRYAFYFANSFMGLIGKQTLHDKIAKTYVVNAEDLK